MKLITLAFVIFLSLTFQCQPISPDSAKQDSGLAFYLLRDSTIATYQILHVPIDSLELSSAPLFIARDIKTYSWSTHTFVLKPESDFVLKPICTVGRRSRDIPFIVKVSNQRIYLGEFYSPASSLSPQCAYIAIGSLSPYKLSYSQLASQPDMRSDSRIHDALQAAGVLIK